MQNRFTKIATGIIKVLITYPWLPVVCFALIAFANGSFKKSWKKHRVVYDRQQGKDRCIDKRTGEFLNVDPPCWVITPKGRERQEKRETNCVQKGGDPGACKDEARAWIFSKGPGKKVNK
jgi:hypothetical protein